MESTTAIDRWKHSHHEVAEEIGTVEVGMSFHVIGEFSGVLITHVLF